MSPQKVETNLNMQNPGGKSMILEETVKSGNHITVSGDGGGKGTLLLGSISSYA